MFRILTLLFLIFIFYSCSFEKDNSWKKIKSKGEIIIGIDESFPPMTFRVNNEIKGIDVDLANAVFKRLNVRVKFKSVIWKDVINELTNGKIDIIWSGLSISDERKKLIDFSIPYIQTKQVIVVKKDSTINIKEDLKNKKVGVQKGTTSRLAIEKDLKNFSKLVEYIDVESELNDLINKKIDAIVIDEIVAKYFLSKYHGDFKILFENYGHEVFAVGIRKEDVTLKTKINKELTRLMKNNTEAQIFKKWIGETQILSEYLQRLKEIKGFR